MAGGNSPCASCKLLRRRCATDCIFAPFFPSDDPHKFAVVHKVFGASNVSKMLQDLPIQQRPDAVSSLVYESNARMRDPVYGCVGAISYLQNLVSQLQMQLAVAQTEILCIQMQQDSSNSPSPVLMHPSASSSHADEKNNNNNKNNTKNNTISSSSFILTNNLSGLPQFFNSSAAASAGGPSGNVTQERPTRESLWA
ncbi:Protein LATERAL ORGAN BOUNDARIES [Zostera marina]|uniref:Protein LATERAL ORGAN BOUNDARIES n=1 Tax=Zostera marina TaxID=29655 RepID=A0A0K9PM51_ZOSMR|nr:Protein LATERAL ORGAN BOUNDARIES [Zostera marina]